MRWEEHMHSSRPILSCRNLTFRYGAQAGPVFENLSFHVDQGEAVLFMGPSGCGKSTLAYCLAGLYPEYAGSLEGEILIGERPVSQMPPSKRAQEISILFQNPDNQFCMGRPDHEILFALENMNYDGDLQERMQELLHFSGLEAIGTAPIHTLSGGTKQKLALATSLATNARILVLDEPFANLDPAACVQLAGKLKELNRQGLTLLIVDHNPGYWRSFISRIALMDGQGTLVNENLLPDQLESYRELFDRHGLFLDNHWLTGITPPETVPGSPAIVRAKDLALKYEKETVIDRLTFQLKKGSVTALIGPNGSGKTTLLCALAGVGKYKGELLVGGRAGLVFQNPRFQFLTLTVQEEVLTTLHVIDPPADAAILQKRAEDLLDEFGLLPYKEVSPYSLSQGQQRRLALLSMLAGDRPLLLLDEPTYAQDERSSRKILKLLNQRVQQGLTAVIATHDLALARAFANQILLLENGRLTPMSTDDLDHYAAERGILL